MDQDRRRWDDRHAGRPAEPPRPPDALAAADLDEAVVPSGADLAGGRRRSRLLDVASGLGPVARWAAQRGMDVVALDVSPVAIAAITSCAEADAIDARCVDLDDGLPSDLGEFELVVCQRFRSPPVIDALPRHVTHGGVLVVTVLSEVGASTPGPFHAPPGELERLLGAACPGWERLHATEGDGEASMVLRRPAHDDTETGP